MLPAAALLFLALQNPTASPLEPGARWPDFAASPAGSPPMLLWTAAEGSGVHRLLVAELGPKGWMTPMEVARGEDWFVNWADFPRAARSASGQGLVTWLRRTGDSPYAYEVRFAIREPGGAWRSRGVLHEDRKPGEHGFVSLLPLARDRGFFAAWLDGRGRESMGLYARRITPEGGLGEEFSLDPRTCDCCQTDAVLLADGSVVIAYRDRSDEEIRDIAVVRGRPGDPASWTEPRRVHADEWLMPGCPVNGPALATDGKRIAVVWYTMGAEQRPRILLAYSQDGGASFSAPVLVDGERPFGRVDALFLPSGKLLVCWLGEGDGGPSGARWLGRLYAGEEAHPAVQIGEASAARAAGFLRLAPRGKGVLAAWTRPEEGGLVLEELTEDLFQ